MATTRFTRRQRRIAALALGAAWLVSLGLPAAHLADGDEAPGLSILMIGWIAVLGLQPAWLANLVLWLVLPIVSTIRAPRPYTLGIAGFVLIGCAIAALFWRDLPDDSGSNLIVAWGAGFYLWMAAVIGGGVAALVTSRMEQFSE